MGRANRVESIWIPSRLRNDFSAGDLDVPSDDPHFRRSSSATANDNGVASVGDASRRDEILGDEGFGDQAVFQFEIDSFSFALVPTMLVVPRRVTMTGSLPMFPTLTGATFCW